MPKKGNNNKKNNNRPSNNRPSSGGGRTSTVQTAKQAAASGSFNSNNAQALRQAGVSKQQIQKIRGVSQQVNSRTANAEAARNNPTYQGAGFQDALQNQVAGGSKVGQQFYDSLDAGVRGDLTSQQVAEYAMSQGYGLGDQWQTDFGTKTSPAQTLKQAINSGDKMRVGQLLKIAAGQGKGTDFVSNREFRKIFKFYDGDKSGLKITNRMDKINAKQADKENGYNPMGLQVGTFGKINKGKYGDGRDVFYQGVGNSTLGKEFMANIARKQGKNGGPLSQLALNYKGSNIEGMKGKFGVYGADANGSGIFSPGQGGKAWSENKLNNPSTTTYEPWATDVQATDVEGGGGGGGGFVEPETTEEEVDRSASSGAGGLDLSSWATGYKKARSARQRAGRQAQGLASQKKTPFKSWNS
jgi:hypothetical protein